MLIQVAVTRGAGARGAVARGAGALLLAGSAAGAAGIALAVPAGASSTICVGIVVAYGVANPGSGANSTCVTVPTGSTGADVLAARARALGRPPPVYRSDGLLCQIDGYPRGKCVETGNGGYKYWSYWHLSPGASRWQYSSAGVRQYTVRNGWVEGWSFQNGGGEGNTPPPRVSYASVCAKASPSPTSPPKPAPTTAAPHPTSGHSSTAPAGSGAGGGTGGGTGSGGTGGGTGSGSPGSGGTQPGGPVPGRAGSSTSRPAPAGSSAARRSAAARASRSAAAARASTAAADRSATAAGASPGGSASAGTGSGTQRVTRLTPVADPGSDTPTSAPVGVFAGGLIVAGLGAAAILRARKSP